MKNLKLFFTFTALIYCVKLFSQESIVFDKQYLFDDRNNYIKDFKQTHDGGFICGGSIGFEMFDERFLLFKTDSLGEVEWYKYHDSVSVNSHFWAVDVTKTGNYIGFGITQENPDWHPSGAIVMYNAIGDTLWSRQYAFTSPDNPNVKSKVAFCDGIYSKNNDLVAVGSITEDERGTNPLVVKTNLVGDTIWTWRLYDTNNVIVLRAIAETTDGHYVAVGTAYDSISNKQDQYPRRGVIIKINQSGELDFLVEWNELNDCEFTGISINSSGNFIISGFHFRHWPEISDTKDYGFILQTDNIGETIFYKELEYGKGAQNVDITLTKSDDVICLALFGPPISEDWKMDVLLQKYSQLGELIWIRSIGEQTVINWPYSVTCTNDEGIAFCGAYITDSGPRSWLVKVDSLGNGVYNEGWINSVNENILLSGITIYPNPAQEIINISIPSDNQEFTASIFNLAGTEIKRYDEYQSCFYIGDLNNGIYLVKINVNNQVFYQKLIINQ